MIAGDRIRELYEIYRNNPLVTTDSRNVPPGSVFFALRGDNFDGNRFAVQALGGGAVCAVIDSEEVVREVAGDGFGVLKDRLFVVDDVLRSLQDLARYHRQVLGIPIFAITGTNGKTTTKELISAVLSSKFNLYATRGNLNNHIGVPLTLLAMKPGTELGVVEMGASAKGEISLLCGIARPDYGLITNIGRAHLDGFGGVEGVRVGKGELYDWLAAERGTALVRTDDAVLAEMAREREGLKTYEYDAGYADGYETNLEGDYNKFNVAAAVAVGRFLGIPETGIREAIRYYVPDNNRSQLMVTDRNLVIADCYNANPSSMKAAVSNFISGKWTADDGSELKKIAILGDMHELGEWSGAEHSEIVSIVSKSTVERALFVGNNFLRVINDFAVEGLPAGIKAFADVGELIRYIERAQIEGSALLVKGSRAEKLEKVLSYL